MKAKRRDTFEVNINFTDADGNDFVFTTHTAKMEVRTALANDGGTVLVTLNSPSEIVMTTGRVQLIKDKANMDIDPGDYFYDLQITYPDATVRTWVQGAFVVTDDVTV